MAGLNKKWVLRSFQQYFYTNYTETAIHWPETNFDATQDEWVMPLVENFAAKPYQGAEHQACQVRVKITVARTSQADRVWEICHALEEALENQTITIYAYGDSSNNIMGYLRLHESEPVPLTEPGAEIAQLDVIFDAAYDQAFS